MKKIIVLAMMIVIVIVINIQSITLFVDITGNGDYTQFDHAIYHMALNLNSGETGTIFVRPGVYFPFMLYQNTDYSLNIIGLDRDNCIIDSYETSETFIFSDYTNTEFYIKNLTFQNSSSSGIVIGYEDYPPIGNVVIDNCVIKNNGHTYNNSTEDFNGAGIRCYGGFTVKNSIIESNYLIPPENSYVERFGGGIYVQNNTVNETIISNCEFIDNKSAGGGAIWALGSGDILLENNLFKNHIAYHDISGNYLYLGGIVCTFHDCQGDVRLNNNIFRNNNCNYSGTVDNAILYFGTCDSVFLQNNTIIDNQWATGIFAGNGVNFISIRNELVTNNGFGVYIYRYCDYIFEYNNVVNNCHPYGYIQNLNSDIIPGQGCICLDPQLDENYYPLWNSTTKSPCIDTGDPTILDSDETPSDIGAIPYAIHDFKNVDATSDRIRWRSFPVIDRTLHAQGQETEYICAPVEEQTTSFKIWDQEDVTKEWNDPNWNGELDFLYSQKGYKIQMQYADSVNIPVSGIKMADNTVIDLHEGVPNWIGYFVKETMSIQDAFEGIWDHLLAVAGEDWHWENGGVMPKDRCLLIYGKMYDVKVDADCSFTYGGPITPIDPKEREKTAGFDYVEKADYTPINIIDLGDPDVEEIGIFQGDVCVGAAKVEELPVQILAFPETNSRADEEISFQLYYGDRSYQKPEKFFTYQQYSNSFVEKDIELHPYETVVITFGEPEVPAPEKLSLSNYPNPFNPITQISYSLPVDGEIELTIYNIKGQRVRTLLKGKAEAGHYNITWDSTDNSGRKVSSGVYFYQLKTAQKTLHKKMLLMK